MSRIKSILLALGLIIGFGGVAVITSGPAHAASCATGWFDMQNANDSIEYLLDGGHNNPIFQTSANSSDFCLVNSGTAKWYEFMDRASLECLNVGSDGQVYEDSCIDSTPEQWNQSIPGDHHWENRHTGNLMSSICNDDSNVTVENQIPECASGSNQNQSWATPGS